MVNLSIDSFLDMMTHTHDRTSIRIERTSPTTWLLHSRQLVPRPPTVVFPFFANASNLERITPPEIGFEILTRSPIEMKAGTRIDYHIRLYGVRVRWQTLISEWNPPFDFADIQIRGPYAEWVHRHRFTATADGKTLVEDEVRFRLPLGRLGAIGAPLVKRQLRRIFAHRYEAISQALGDATPAELTGRDR